MHSEVAARSLELLPGYVAISIDACCDPQPALRLCLLVRSAATADKSVPPLILLRDHLDARVFLGCVLDAGGVAQQWVEIWVQDLSGLDQSLLSYRRLLSNQALDQRWEASFAGFDAMDSEALIRTGLELQNPSPLFRHHGDHFSVTYDATGAYRTARKDGQFRKS